MESHEYHRLRAFEDEHWWFLGLHGLVLRVLAGHLPAGPSRLLDAGCGTGGLLVRLGALGSAEGIDASPLAVQLARERGLQDVRQADLNDPGLEAEAYDAITSIDVLYHTGIRDDAAVIGHLFRALRPGGVLFLHLPAFEALRSRHDRQVHTRTRYRRPQVRRLLHEAGFELLHSSYRVTLLAPLVVAQRALRTVARRLGVAGGDSDVAGLPGWLNRLLLLQCRWENALSRRVPLPFGISVYAVARRPESPAGVEGV